VFPQEIKAVKNQRPIVAVIGDARLEADSPLLNDAEEVGKLLVEAGCRVLTGGLGGVMEAASRGAHHAKGYQSGDTIGILPGHNPSDANAFVDIALPTGLDHVRNSIVAHADAVVAIGGGAGTLSEIALAWMHGRLVVALRRPGWSGRLADRRIDGRIRHPEIPDDRVCGADSAEEAVALVKRHLRDQLP
jgi:uncharacterized protein (TIGR00725 family)